MTQLIPVGSLYATVDDEDYPLLSRHHWTLGDGTRSSTFYAITKMEKKVIRMHALIMATNLVDHVNGDGLDNRKENLRPATSSENNANAAKRKTTNGGMIPTSQYKGVSWKKGHKWMARVQKDGVNHHLGYYADETTAALAYDAKAKELFGEFARTNF